MARKLTFDPGLIGEFAVAANLSDSADLTNGIAAIYCGSAGVVRCVPAGQPDASVTVDITVVAGGMIPFKVRRVYSAGTTVTSTNILAVY